MKRTAKRTSKKTASAAIANAITIGIATITAQTPALETLIEQRKNELLEESIAEDGAYWTGGYWNWFGEQIDHARDMVETFANEDKEATPAMRAVFARDLEGWTEARSLFFALAPTALEHLKLQIAEHITIKYKGTTTAGDVSGLMENTTNAEIRNCNR